MKNISNITSKININGLTWAKTAMICFILLSAGAAAYFGANVAVNFNVEDRITILENTLKTIVNSTFYSLQKEATYLICPVTSGATTYYCMQNGTTGKLDLYSTNASYVINSAFGNITASPPQKRIVLKGSFTLDSSLVMGSYTYVDALQATITMAGGTMADTVQISSGATMSEWNGGTITGS